VIRSDISLSAFILLSLIKDKGNEKEWLSDASF
jgi:hypothetical protein